MAKNLLEAYAKRINIAESVYGQTHNGAKMPNYKKMAVAACLNNVSKFLNEAFDSSTATQRSDMGNWKRFCLNLTNVALPNLIAFDLVMVSPMTSLTGYVAYVQYVTGSNKGETKADTLLNNPFKLGDVDPNYTADRVTEAVAAGADYFPAWTPVVKGAFTTIVVNSEEVEFNPRASYTDAEKATIAHKDYKSIATDGTITFGNFSGDGTKDNPSKIPSASVVAGKVAYVYDNVVIPQNDLPTIKAEIKNIPLLAKARRIAVYYSQIAAFQAKTDYGLDLGDQLAEKAVGQLSYEIDTEIVKLIDDTAGTPDAELTWSKTLPVGVNKRDHYAGFAEIIEIARQKIYDRTKRFAPNYMICASNLLPVLTFMDAFKAAPAGSINGPYFAGTLGGLKVFVSPAMKAGDFVIGVNGDDLMSSVAVYAPYMPIVPTQLLQFADGATSQGWSTMYDLKVLNEDLCIKGQLTA